MRMPKQLALWNTRDTSVNSMELADAWAAYKGRPAR